MAKKAKTIEITDIRGRDTRRQGNTIAGKVEHGNHATIVVGESIRLHGVTYAGKPHEKAHDQTFKIGDTAEYGSYNLHYLGTIVAIGAKTVTIEEPYKCDKPRRHQLSIHTFNWRNKNFDLERIAASNAETRMVI